MKGNKTHKNFPRVEFSLKSCEIYKSCTIFYTKKQYFSSQCSYLLLGN